MINFIKFIKRKIFICYRLFYYKFFVSNNRKIKFSNDLKNFEKKIIQKQNFAFSRFSDGELFIIQNKKLIISDNFWQLEKKKFYTKFSKNEKKEFLPSKHQFYRSKLIESLNFKMKNYYKGISCVCCNGLENVNFMKGISGVGHDITFSNLFQNGNYPYFVEVFFKLFKRKKIILIANENVSIKTLPFKIEKKFDVGENCFINNYSLIDELKKFIKNNKIENHIFLICASSLSNVLIYELYKEFNNNTYLDIGSTLNFHFNNNKNIKSRSYLSEYWEDKYDIEFLNRFCYW
jgi:hypothetical protein